MTRQSSSCTYILEVLQSEPPRLASYPKEFVVALVHSLPYHFFFVYSHKLDILNQCCYDEYLVDFINGLHQNESNCLLDLPHKKAGCFPGKEHSTSSQLRQTEDPHLMDPDSQNYRNEGGNVCRCRVEILRLLCLPIGCSVH